MIIAILRYSVAFVAFYLFSAWILRKLASISRVRYLQARGEVAPNVLMTEADDRPLLLAFFHPYCNAGGGGERVLWTIIREVQRLFPPSKVRILLYTGDVEASPGEILERAKARFAIDLQYEIDFLYLHKRSLVEDSQYPRFTMIMQSFGSMILGVEAFSYVVPDIMFDTMGYAFTYPLFRWLGGSKVLAYVHYPTISSDMLDAVSASSGTTSIYRQLKTFYYGYFAELYGFMGRRAHLAVVNSTWTKNHIEDVWNVAGIRVVYPPCDTQSFRDFPIVGRRDIIISISQFRPEKNQRLQVESFARFVKEGRYEGRSRVKLVIVGSCRNKDDHDRADQLKAQALRLGVSEQVEFAINVPYDELKRLLSQAKIGLHTMWNEHFGIGIVEFQAAGCIPLVHKSGGPLLDIVVPFQGQKTGFHANSSETYAEALDEIFALSEQQQVEIATASRNNACSRFSERVFERELMDAITPHLCMK